MGEQFYTILRVSPWLRVARHCATQSVASCDSLCPVNDVIVAILGHNAVQVMEHPTLPHIVWEVIFGEVNLALNDLELVERVRELLVHFFLTGASNPLVKW